jgi:hypothetical protein
MRQVSFESYIFPIYFKTKLHKIPLFAEGVQVFMSEKEKAILIFVLIGIFGFLYLLRVP